MKLKIHNKQKNRDAKNIVLKYTLTLKTKNHDAKNIDSLFQNIYLH